VLHTGGENGTDRRLPESAVAPMTTPGFRARRDNLAVQPSPDAFSPMTDEELLAAAAAARENAHAPYSAYRVGAAVLDEHGRLHAGCNVENASYPEGICAEANAIGSMVAAGGRRIAAIAVIGGAAETGSGRFDDIKRCTPCGGCRQRILEFADDATRVLILDAGGKPAGFGIDDLLPDSFRLG
jgi:cytidine deaminase